jgi:TRAP-type mannitol/chloroaromatic compound transport system permease small subunit
MIPLAAVLLLLQGLVKLIRDILLLFDIDTDSRQETRKGETL